MTLLFNVTDAIGTAPNHGITRTERRLAQALDDHDVGFVVVREGRLWRVVGESIGPFVDRGLVDMRPVVERFGVDAAPAGGRSLSMRARLSGRGGVGNTSRTVPIEPLRATSDDTIVSVGLDWVHGMVHHAERHVFGAGGRFVGMCYDLIPIDHPEWLFPPDPDGFRRYLRDMTRVASSVLCISECTQRDLLRHFPELGAERSPVIRLGADVAESVSAEHDRFAASVFGDQPYAIYCATLDRRKNHQLLYRAMRELVRRGVPGNLVFVGRVGSGVDDLLDCLRHDRAVAGRVAHVTDCDDLHLAALYRRATCAVYPSLYEGWGLGVTEALAHGTPCVVATGSSLPEAGLGVCRELSPLRTAPWVDTLAEYFADPPSLPALQLPTWAGAARDLIDLVQR